MNDIEPRVAKLEDMYRQTSKAIVEIEVDFKHLAKSVEKIQETMQMAVELMAKQEATVDAIKAITHRLEKLEDSFGVCAAEKVKRSDIEHITTKINDIELKEAKGEWVTILGGTAMKIIVAALLTAILGLIIVK